MNPKPLASLNHFTVPVMRAICSLLLARRLNGGTGAPIRNDARTAGEQPRSSISPLVSGARYHAVALSLARSIIRGKNDVNGRARLNERTSGCNLLAHAPPPAPSAGRVAGCGLQTTPSGKHAARALAARQRARVAHHHRLAQRAA